MTEKEQLLRHIQGYLSGDLALPEFWKAYNFIWANLPEDALNDQDWDFFSEINDRLHHTDWHSPSNPALIEPITFRKWLDDKVSTYLKTN